MEFVFSTFKREDFPEYLSWYADAELNLHLGPMKEDDEWLHAVMNETDGCHYSIFDGKDLLAVVGVIFPDVEHSAYFITDFAIKPIHRGKGIGSIVLDELIRLHPLKVGQKWKAVIDVKNSKAKRFFEKNGWISSEMPDEHGMFMLKLTRVNAGSSE